MSHDAEANASGDLFGLCSPVRWKSVIVLICASVLMAFLIPNSMLSEGGFADDNSVFAYIGWLMQRGYVPYRDVWDHKGPVLYAINWAGWVIAPSGTVGIGLLQVLAYALAFFLLATVLKRFASQWAIALLALFSVSFIAGHSAGGNITESWGLAPSTIAIYLVFEVPSDHLRWHHSILIATAVSIAFWIRPDLSLIPLTAGATMVAALVRRSAFSHTFTFIIVGVGTVALESGLILLPFWRAGALSALYAEYFTYNRNYAETISMVDRISNAAVLVSGLSRRPIFVVGTIGWAVLAWNAWHGRSDQHMSGAAELMILVLFPLVFVCCLTTGRAYETYLLTLWPVLTIVGARVVEDMMQFGASAFSDSSPEKKVGVAVAAALLLVQQLGTIARAEVLELRGGHETAAVAEYIDAITTPADRIVSVGDVTAVQVALYAQRLPATAYIYQLPLVHRANPHEYVDRTVFLRDINAEQPAVILSMPGPVGSLCRSAIVDSDRDRHDAAAYGYSMGTIRTDLEPVLSRNYALVNGFKSACVYVRRGRFAGSVSR